MRGRCERRPGMCVVGGTGQFRVLPSQVTISSLESQMRTWATVPTVLTKHPPALFSPPTPALSIPSPGPISSRPQHMPADALYRPSPRALRRSPQEHAVPVPRQASPSIISIMRPGPSRQHSPRTHVRNLASLSDTLALQP